MPALKPWLALSILLIAALALAMRLPRLDQRPLHQDEAVHAVKTGELIQSGRYQYNPTDYHGPTLYYFALPFVLFGEGGGYANAGESAYRIVPVLFGVALVILLLPFSRFVGPVAAIAAAILTALSPAMAFYSRYYIQEMLLVFFTFTAIYCGWRYAQAARMGWALMAGLCLGLMQATKETSIIVYGGMIAGAAYTIWRSRRESPSDQDEPHWKPNPGHFAAAVGVAAAVAIVFLSGFFTNLRGPLDGVLAFGSYFQRAGGAGLHDHKWNFYLEFLTFYRNAPGPWWSEALIFVLSLAGVASAFRQRFPSGAEPRVARFLAIYTFFLLGVYSSIPYKTPWCMLGFLHGMILLAGIGASAILRALPGKPLKGLAAAALLALAAQLGAQACRTNFHATFSNDTRNPYIYAHTSNNLLELVERIEDIARVHDDGEKMLIKVVTDDYWPLPWYLRRFERVGYWDEIPDDPDAPIVISSAEDADALSESLQDEYLVSIYSIRPRVLLSAHIRMDLWDEFMKTRTSD